MFDIINNDQHTSKLVYKNTAVIHVPNNFICLFCIANDNYACINNDNVFNMNLFKTCVPDSNYCYIKKGCKNKITYTSHILIMSTDQLEQCEVLPY